jgi:hypothetical protein
MGRPRRLDEDESLTEYKLWQRCCRFRATAEICHLGVDLRPPSLEIVLRRLEIFSGDLHIIDVSVPFVEPFRLLIELIESELIFNLLGDLRRVRWL